MNKSAHKLQQLKSEDQKFSVLTAYDATFARVIADANIDAILVGDSLGMVVQGKSSTLPVTISEMVYHTETVVRGVEQRTDPSKAGPLIIADLPFMTYQETHIALENAAQLMRAGANMVKMEGGSWLTEAVNKLVENGIPVCAHLGLTPQSVNKFGGYKVQAKTKSQQQQLLDDVASLEQAGASFIVLECIPANIAAEVTLATSMSTIGIGAGSNTDAQVLVSYDLLGLSNHPARFVKNFLTKENMNTNSGLLDA